MIDFILKIGSNVKITYKTRAARVVVGGETIVVPFVGEGLIAKSPEIVRSTMEGFVLEVNNEHVVLLRPHLPNDSPGKIVCILASSITHSVKV